MKEACSLIAIWLTFIVWMANVHLAVAADYPTKPVTLICPYSAGGGTDVLGRLFASAAERLMGQPFVVVNKTGAGGMVGGQTAAQAAPDGCTLLLSNSSIPCTLEWEAVNGRTLPFTLHDDFTTIGNFVVSPPLVTVHYDGPWKTLGDLIRDVKAKPNHYASGSGGLYTVSRLAIESFARALGLKFRHVPFSGGGPTITALVGRHIDISSQFSATILPLVAGKKLRALAVQGDRRLKEYPDVPTVKELGIDAECPTVLLAILAPKTTPIPIVEKLRGAAQKVAKEKSFIDAVEKTGNEVHFMDADKFAKFLEIESQRIREVWAELVKESAAK